jgi:hypothetical protein
MSRTADTPPGPSHASDTNGDGDERPFVPPDFRVPSGCSDDTFLLVPLSPEHNDRDYSAWMSSIGHIQRTPGFERYDWPRSMSIEDNLREIVQHADDFRHRVGFTYSVMAGDDVIGCVYIYPSGRPGHANVRSWVRKDLAHLDRPLYDLVDRWLRRDWPFEGFSYSPREQSSPPLRRRAKTGAQAETSVAPPVCSEQSADTASHCAAGP